MKGSKLRDNSHLPAPPSPHSQPEDQFFSRCPSPNKGSISLCAQHPPQKALATLDGTEMGIPVLFQTQSTAGARALSGY